MVGWLIHWNNQAIIRDRSLYGQLRLLGRHLSLGKIASSLRNGLMLFHELLSFSERTLTSLIRVAQFDLSYTNSICLETSLDYASKAFHLLTLPKTGLFRMTVDL